MASSTNEQSRNSNEIACSICFNLRLNASLDNIPSINRVERRSCRPLRQSELQSISHAVQATCQVKIDFYELVESTRLGDCTYCLFLFQCLKSARARIGGSSEPHLFNVIGRRGFPLYISWMERGERKALEVYACPGGSYSIQAHHVLA